MPSTFSRRAATLAVVASLSLTVSVTAMSSQSLGLPAAELYEPRERVAIRGVTAHDAELLFTQAVAAVYFAGSGEVRLLLGDGSAERERALGDRFGVAGSRLLQRGERTGGTTLAEFLAEVDAAIARDGERLGPYLLMHPIAVEAPAELSAATPAAAPDVAAQAVVLSEGFEGDPWTRWQRQDNKSGAYQWTATTCAVHGGAQAADAIRGGTTGGTLDCAAMYPTSLQTWMIDTQCRSFQGVGQAWFEGYGSIASEDGYDLLAVLFNVSGTNYQGTAFSGTFSGWWRVIFNLKQWYGMGDLTQRQCNTLAFLFMSDNTIATGFGARIDDVSITTDSAPAFNCAAVAAPPSGPAPLDVALSAVVNGASGAAQYLWDLDDGSTSTSPSPAHRFLLRGSYSAAVQVTDGSSVCTASVPVTVSGSGVAPTPGVFEGTTSQGKAISFTVAADGHISPYTYGYQCSSASGSSTITTTGCTYSDGGFSCGGTTCQQFVNSARISGTFDSLTTAVGTLAVTTGSNPTIGSGCCYLSGVTWTATRTGAATCSVACSANVPFSGQPGAPLAFSATATPANCTGTPTYSWTFGDGATSTQEDPSHSYAAAGSYPWTLAVTVDGQTCNRNGTITISGGASCSLSCDATVPATASAGAPVPFQATATPSNCTGTPSYSWTFGDGGSSGLQSPTHSYANAGSYPWTLTVTADSQTCARNGTVSVSAAAGPEVYMVPSVAHLPGAGGTQWRTDVAVVGNASATAHLTLTYYSDTQTLGTAHDLAPGATVEWRDILVSRFGLGAGASSSGVLHVASDQPIVVTSRTYNQAAAGTFGQYYPACRLANALAYGQVGILAQLKKSSSFRTNIGILNLGAASCSVTVRLFKADGIQIGANKTLTAAGGRWVQQYDIFANVGAGSSDIAYATVEVQTPGGQVWAYASVVDTATGDPTTIPVLLR